MKAAIDPLEVVAHLVPSALFLVAAALFGAACGWNADKDRTIRALRKELAATAAEREELQGRVHVAEANWVHWHARAMEVETIRDQGRSPADRRRARRCGPAARRPT